jgi:subtilisin family serine protease
VILTAAQCLRDKTELKVFTNYGSYQVACEMHPDFPQNHSFDFGLCILDRTFPAPPVKLARDGNALKKGALIHIAGYGCHKDGGVDAEYGKFGLGSAWVIQVPDSQAQEFDVVTVGAALCHGDAGGGAYFFDNNQTAVLIGVNSASDLQVKSNIAATATSTFMDWAKQWASKRGADVIICGLHENAVCDNNVAWDADTVTPGELLTNFRSDSPWLAFLRTIRIIVRKGESINQRVFEICGTDQPDSFWDQYRKIRENRRIETNLVLDEDEEVSIPVCLSVNRTMRIVRTGEVNRTIRIVVRKGESINQRIFEICRTDQPDSFWDQYKKIRENRRIETNSVLDEDEEISVPVCKEFAPDLFVNQTIRIVVRKGEAIDRRVLETCGTDQPDSFFEQYRSIDKNPGIKTNSVLDEDEEVSIPVCKITAPRLEVRDEVQPGEDDYDIWKRYREKWPSYDGNPKKESIRSRNFQDVFRELNRPFMTTDLKLVPGRPLVIPLAPLYDEIAPPAVKDTQPDTGVFGLASSQYCSELPSSVNYPYNLNDLLDVLRANKYARRSGSERKSVTILIADSGIRGASNAGVFTQELFSSSSPTFEETATSVRPSFEIPEDQAEHGTLVASIVLGGPLFARMQVAERARVQFIVKQVFFKGDNSKSTVPASWETDLLNVINDQHPAIVNLSIKSGNDRQRAALAKEGGPLFVVAAGNLDGDIDGKNIYPAKYGGLNSKNVITVGATAMKDDGKDGKMVWGRFSNRSARYIDIAAPGCNVPALSYDLETSRWSEKRVTGTSFSAPMVSFAAAMILTEYLQGTMSAADVKRRLLASADLHSEFREEVNHGRTLNLVKALSLYHDVIELAPGRYAMGDVKFFGPDPRTGAIGELKETIPCGGRAQPLKINEIYKIRPNFTGERGPTTLVYYKATREEVFQSLECAFRPDLKVQIRAEGSEPITKRINEILDFVPKFRAFEICCSRLGN